MAGQGLSQQEAGELIARVRAEVQQQTLQELFTKISERCFDVCVTKPSKALSSSEQKCLAMCMDRYVDAMVVVSNTMSERSNATQ